MGTAATAIFPGKAILPVRSVSTSGSLMLPISSWVGRAAIPLAPHALRVNTPNLTVSHRIREHQQCGHCGFGTSLGDSRHQLHTENSAAPTTVRDNHRKNGSINVVDSLGKLLREQQPLRYWWHHRRLTTPIPAREALRLAKLLSIRSRQYRQATCDQHLHGHPTVQPARYHTINVTVKFEPRLEWSNFGSTGYPRRLYHGFGANNTLNSTGLEHQLQHFPVGNRSIKFDGSVVIRLDPQWHRDSHNHLTSPSSLRRPPGDSTTSVASVQATAGSSAIGEMLASSPSSPALTPNSHQHRCSLESANLQIANDTAALRFPVGYRPRFIRWLLIRACPMGDRLGVSRIACWQIFYHGRVQSISDLTSEDF